MPAIDVELLLESIQQYSFLYDKKHSSFKDVAKKNNAWEEIAETLTAPVEDVKTRWRTLRERFSKELKKNEENTRSGRGLVDTSLQWEWFESMTFLINHVKPRKTCSSQLTERRFSESQSSQNTFDSEAALTLQHMENNEESQNSESYEEAQYAPETQASVPSPSANSAPMTHTSSAETPQNNNCGVTVSKRKRTRLASEQNDIDMELLKTLKHMDNRTEDEDDIFGKLIACELRKVKNTEEKQRRKAKIYMVATGLELIN